MKTIILWFRNDLRIHDHPALMRAALDADCVVPVFIYDQAILSGKHSSANRNRFLSEGLDDLQQSFKKLGGDLLIREGDPGIVLAQLAHQFAANDIYYTADYTPFATIRDKKTKRLLADKNINLRSFGGKLAVDGLDKLRTKQGNVYKVFTPFWKNWQQIGRRELATIPSSIRLPKGYMSENAQLLNTLSNMQTLSPDTLKGGETAGRKQLGAFLDTGLDLYLDSLNDLSKYTSRISSYLHFGCLSVREIETMLPDTPAAAAFHRQLAWRDFYNYILFNFPKNSQQEFQERYRTMKWETDQRLMDAWTSGQTGYPVVDAAMRQLKAEGWMHNRARLIVGSFLTKDLGLDWRMGEQHFMRWLIDGDQPNNNGNWQWIASVGVDPAPLFRRLYNPTTQQRNYDPSGDYVRRYVPELSGVADEHLSEPWKMSDDQQNNVGCVIGVDYPSPIVDHALARKRTLERYTIPA